MMNVVLVVISLVFTPAGTPKVDSQVVKMQDMEQCVRASSRILYMSTGSEGRVIPLCQTVNELEDYLK